MLVRVILLFCYATSFKVIGKIYFLCFEKQIRWCTSHSLAFRGMHPSRRASGKEARMLVSFSPEGEMLGWVNHLLPLSLCSCHSRAGKELVIRGVGMKPLPACTPPSLLAQIRAKPHSAHSLVTPSQRGLNQIFPFCGASWPPPLLRHCPRWAGIWSRLAAPVCRSRYPQRLCLDSLENPSARSCSQRAHFGTRNQTQVLVPNPWRNRT